jgi:hypothetical protein
MSSGAKTPGSPVCRDVPVMPGNAASVTGPNQAYHFTNDSPNIVNGH